MGGKWHLSLSLAVDAKSSDQEENLLGSLQPGLVGNQQKLSLL